MSDTAIELPAAGVFTETQTGRGLYGIVDLRSFGRRSDARGAARFAIHLACIAVTGTLVWLTLPSWFLLVPAMLLHGLTLVTTPARPRAADGRHFGVVPAGGLNRGAGRRRGGVRRAGLFLLLLSLLAMPCGL